MNLKSLNHINNPQDLRALEKSELESVVNDLRAFIIDVVAVKEGHLGASLGVVELTVALHYVFNTPEDLLIWDVGHQAYGHKILTDRKSIFETNRQLNGISGFPKRTESEYDAFGVGHSSTSISAGLGMAIASKLNGDNKKQHIAVIGDASIASGMAFEGLNHAGVTDVNLLVILNDNAIGMDPSVGALKQYLTNVKSGFTEQDNIFEALNFNYSGPIDGHDTMALIAELERLKQVKGIKFLHVITTKGKGLKLAEENQVKYHAPGKFDAKTGELLIHNKTNNIPPKFQDVFGLTLVELAKKNDSIVGITPAMPTGSSLKFMMDEIPERAFDVGIAEQHAVTLAAGMSTQGLIPFCNIYSTFLQRAYDQLIHDVAVQNLPILFAIDRAGVVGPDGKTHTGSYDISFLRCIPNMTLMAPANENETRQMLQTGFELDSPSAVRYPRGCGPGVIIEKNTVTLEIGKASQERSGESIVILSFGSLLHAALESAETLNASVVNMRFIKPMDENIIEEMAASHTLIVTIEDNVVMGGAGSAVNEILISKNISTKVLNLGLPDHFQEHGSREELLSDAGLDAISITAKIREIYPLRDCEAKSAHVVSG